MIGRTAQRIGLIVVAAAAALWLVHGVLALNLDTQGRDRVRAAGERPSPAQVSGALSSFTRAARLNADPTPKIDQAALLITLGRVRPAATLLEQVVRANPGNVRGWTLLASATVRLDPGRSAEASRALRGLFGQPPGFVSQEEPVLTTSGRVLHIVPKAVVGQVDSTLVLGNQVRFSGWSGSVKNAHAASSVLVFANGRLVGDIAPRLPRPDLAGAHPGLARSGFGIVLPLSSLETGGKPGRIQVFGVDGQVTSPILFDCGQRQDLGCQR